MNIKHAQRFAAALFFSTAVLATTGAYAKVYSIPAADAIATVNAPDDWEPSEITNGIEMNSPDGDVYVSIESVKADKISDAVAESVKVLTEQGLVLDQASQKTHDVEANGMKIHVYDYEAKDDDGPTEFSISLVETRMPDTYVMFTARASAEAQKTNDAAMSAIMQSIQLTK